MNFKRITVLILASVFTLFTMGCGAGTGEKTGQSETKNDAVQTEAADAAEAQQEATAGPAEAKAGQSEAAADTTEALAGQQEASSDTTEALAGQPEETEIQVFIAASLKTVMEEVAEKYNETHPEVKITYNADSSGTLLTQIEEGYECDVFFSAAQKQMNTLEEEDKLVVEGTRGNVVNNQVCVITLKDSGTKVTGLSDISSASSIALADGSVPVGKYTRQAMVNAGLLKEAEDVSKISTKEVSEQLGGVEISEQSNVSKVLAAVVEGSCEVGTTYFSDTYGYEDKIEILEKVPYDLTGNVIYPIAQIINPEADDAEKAAALDFVNFVKSDEAKTVFEKYYFDTNVDA